MVSVIASAVRKGNVLEVEGKLYVVLSSENFHPGKGTPTTQIQMRRISDGVKVNERYKTTDSLERAFLDQRAHTYLYEEDNSFVFMDPVSFEQVHVSKDVVGDLSPYLQENMEVQIAQFNEVAVSIELPQRVTLEVVETEPVMKGQTATSSFKPAILSNGVKTGVPTFISAGTRIVVNTEDGSYVERAKD